MMSARPSFHADPSGTFMRYDAKAIGSGSEGAQTELQERWHKVCVFWSQWQEDLDSGGKLMLFVPVWCERLKSMSLQEAHLLVLQVLRHVMEEKLNEHNIQLAQVSHLLSFAFIAPLLTQGWLYATWVTWHLMQTGDPARWISYLDKCRTRRDDCSNASWEYWCTIYTHSLTTGPINRNYESEFLSKAGDGVNKTNSWDFQDHSKVPFASCCVNSSLDANFTSSIYKRLNYKWWLVLFNSTLSSLPLLSIRGSSHEVIQS